MESACWQGDGKPERERIESKKEGGREGGRERAGVRSANVWKCESVNRRRHVDLDVRREYGSWERERGGSFFILHTEDQWGFFFIIHSLYLLHTVFFFVCHPACKALPNRAEFDWEMGRREHMRGRRNTGRSCFIHTANIQSMSLYIIHASF